jgi:hypothetical protein
MTLPDDIQLELDRAWLARSQDNHGRVRVCCRRAAGAAIRRWLAAQTAPPDWGRMAITQLRLLADSAVAPGEVQRAAARLSTTVSEDHTLPFDEDPIEDALAIIRHFAL